jgi:hypothetical protein
MLQVEPSGKLAMQTHARKIWRLKRKSLGKEEKSGGGMNYELVKPNHRNFIEFLYIILDFSSSILHRIMYALLCIS